MKKILPLLAAAMMLLFATTTLAHDKVVIVPLNSSKPQPLAQLDLRKSGGVNISFNNVGLEIRLSNISLFTLWVDPSDVGNVYSFNQENSSNFNAAAGFLVNGTDDMLWFYNLYPTGGSSGSGQSESLRIMGGLTGGYDPDLSGARVTSVVVHVDKVFIDTPGQDANGDGNWTDFDFQIRVIIMGHP